ncbi:hypothetical protein TNCV_4767221 [Trichonephila clavipes]|nr:hypothetical protein TNCV_4767221 [Trichonephila clavipes]
MSKGKRWCSWQNPVLELLSERDSPTERVKPTELMTASALGKFRKSPQDRFRIYPVRNWQPTIEKGGFLMLSVAPKDEIISRFFSHAVEDRDCKKKKFSDPIGMFGAVYIAPRITIAGNMEGNENSMGSRNYRRIL